MRRLASLVLVSALWGCAPKAKTPADAYARFAAAVKASDGGALFDALDPPTRWAWMTVQKWHREAHDIVLSNFPEGPERERELRRFEKAAMSPSGRALFKAEVAPTVLPTLAPQITDNPTIEMAPSGTEAVALTSAGARIPLAQGQRGGWGFSGLAAQAEAQKNRAYHDLELVRASAADYERAAARAAR